jgi:hypothetical protein
MPDHAPVHRHMCSDLVSLTCTDKAGRPIALRGNLEEIGEGSALVLTDTPISRRTRVLVDCENHQLKGFVRSCVHAKTLGYFVEVRLCPESHWSEKWFTPQHLLALCHKLEPKVFHAGAGLSH